MNTRAILGQLHHDGYDNYGASLLFFLSHQNNIAKYFPLTDSNRALIFSRRQISCISTGGTVWQTILCNSCRRHSHSTACTLRWKFFWWVVSLNHRRKCFNLFSVVSRVARASDSNSAVEEKSVSNDIRCINFKMPCAAAVTVLEGSAINVRCSFCNSITVVTRHDNF